MWAGSKRKNGLPAATRKNVVVKGRFLFILAVVSQMCTFGIIHQKAYFKFN